MASRKRTSGPAPQGTTVAAGAGARTKPKGLTFVEHDLRQLKVINVGSLGLVGGALTGAEALRKEFPEVVFTSGRRDTGQQASAMAGNVVRNRRWVEATYKRSPERDALQLWVDRNPAATTVRSIAAGFRSVMADWTGAQKANLSSHFAGLAFDIQPLVGQTGQRVKAAIGKLPDLRQFLQSEGGLVIWHAEFLR